MQENRVVVSWLGVQYCAAPFEVVTHNYRLLCKTLSFPAVSFIMYGVSVSCYWPRLKV